MALLLPTTVTCDRGRVYNYDDVADEAGHVSTCGASCSAHLALEVSPKGKLVVANVILPEGWVRREGYETYGNKYPEAYRCPQHAGDIPDYYRK